MQIPNEYELGWIVGLFEGEACFHISWTTGYPRFEIKVATTDSDVIQKIYEILEVGKVSRRSGAKPNYKEVHIWRLGRKEGCIELCELLLPHMGTRRQEKLTEIIRANKEFPPRKWKHGTRQGYEYQKCRCNKCKAAHAKRHRQMRRKRKLKCHT